MSQVAGEVRAAQAERTRALIIPREHGAWGILLVPLVTGACIGLRSGHSIGNVVLFLTAAITLFWLRTPIESLLGTTPMRATGSQERAMVWKTIAAVGTVAAMSVTALLWGGRNSGLLLIGCICGAAFAVQAAVKLAGRKMRMPSQMIGAIGLTSTAAGAYYVATGQLDSRAFALWFANWLFAGDQIHFVQLRLHGSRATNWAQKFMKGRGFFLGQFVMLAAVVGAIQRGFLPQLALVAFVPVVLRGILWFVHKAERLELHWLGITELLHSVTFGALLIMSFMLLERTS